MSSQHCRRRNQRERPRREAPPALEPQANFVLVRTAGGFVALSRSDLAQIVAR